MQKRKYLRIFLAVAALVVLYFVFQIFRPFLLPIALALTLVSLFYPVFSWIEKRLNGRSGWAALLTCLLITLVIVLPFVALVFTLASEVTHIYSRFETLLEQGYFDNFSLRNIPALEPAWLWLDRYFDLDGLNITGSLSSLVQQASVFFLKHSTTFLSGAAKLITDFFIILVTMFFFFRDGARLGEKIKTWTPISSGYENLLAEKFKTVVRATMLGSAATALAQGATGALIFWLLGIPNVLLWSFLMAIFSLVPVVGTAIVWLPWALYLLATGSVWKGFLLIGLAIGVIGSIDNILRPVKRFSIQEKTG